MRELDDAKKVLEIEARALDSLRARLMASPFSESFVKSVEIIASCRGRVVISGMGKSGLVGRKIAATLASTGTPAFFLHPAEGSHGDLGMVTADDVVIAISYSGEVPELSDLLRYSARKNLPLVAITGHVDSTLGRAGTTVLDIQVKEEACPLGLAPTASTTATLALGDALAVATLNKKGFRQEDFAEFHPGGSLGRRLLTRVRDVMHKGESVPLVASGAPMKEVISVMTQKEVRGVAGVLDASGALIGVITDGDLRRRLEKSQNPLEGIASDLMSRSPKTVDSNELAERALFMMEQFRIQNLFVIDQSLDSARPSSRLPVGLLHLQDLLQAKLR